MKTFTKMIYELYVAPINEAKQQFTSANTSINKNKLPKGYGVVGKHFGWKKGTVHLDVGGGKFDNAIEHLKSHGVMGHVYDPFNRSESQNSVSLASQAHTASLFNVLNVIPEPEHQITALKVAHRALRQGGKIYVGVYEGDGSGKGTKTKKDSFQHNKKLSHYLKPVQQVFPNAIIQHGIIHATKD